MFLEETQFLRLLLITSGWLAEVPIPGSSRTAAQRPKVQSPQSTGGHKYPTPCRSPWTNAGRWRRQNPRWEFCKPCSNVRKLGASNAIRVSNRPDLGEGFPIFVVPHLTIYLFSIFLHSSWCFFGTSMYFLTLLAKTPNFSGGIAGRRCARALGDASWPGWLGTVCFFLWIFGWLKKVTNN